MYGKKLEILEQKVDLSSIANAEYTKLNEELQLKVEEQVAK